MCLSFRHALVSWCASDFSGQKNNEATSICKFSIKQNYPKSSVCVYVGFFSFPSKSLLQKKCVHAFLFSLGNCLNLFLTGG